MLLGTSCCQQESGCVAQVPPAQWYICMYCISVVISETYLDAVLCMREKASKVSSEVVAMVKV